VARAAWLLFYTVGVLGLSLALYRLALSVSDTLEWLTRRRG
jgi:hypothetical protein